MPRLRTGYAVANALRAAYLTLHRQANRQLRRRFGITADHYVVLTHLARRPGLTQQAITRASASDPNTVSALLRRLEERRLLERVADPRDGRAWNIRLTPRGQAVQKDAWAAVRRLHDRLAAVFRNARERDLVLRVLGAIRETLTRPLPEGGRNDRA